MRIFFVTLGGLMAGLLFLLPAAGAAQSALGPLVIRKVVTEVELNVAVTDRHGRYITGLRPSDFEITEDGLPETITSFDEGNAGPVTLQPDQSTPAPAAADPPPIATVLIKPAAIAGASVFVLMDTSNYMYQGRGFVYAQDAIVNFVRSLDGADHVAFYSYSRNLAREARLTLDRAAVVRGVRATVNGDQAALYNALLLTLRDAAHVPGRKVIVVFSNGPDDASMVPPEDVAELAQSQGTPVYIVSTHHAESDPTTATAMLRLASDTGGETFFARRWQDERIAFNSIRDDLAHLYYLTYNPRPNPNSGWRKITVRLRNPALKKDRIRTRSGYRPLPAVVNTP